MDDAGDGPEIIDPDKGKSAVDQIYYIGLGIAIVAAIIIGVVLGIQFMTSGAVGQAKVKEKLIPFAVGALVVFSVFSIFYLKEQFKWNYLVGFALIVLAVFFIFKKW